MFRNAKVGDRAYDILRGWGTIIEIKKDVEYPIVFVGDDDSVCTFTFYGKREKDDKNPSLFWDEIKYEILEKSTVFDLEKELRKLIIKEFEFEERNYYLYYNLEDEEIATRVIGRGIEPFKIYFTEKSIHNFFEAIKFKYISKEEFFKAYKKVFGGRNENM